MLAALVLLSTTAVAADNAPDDTPRLVTGPLTPKQAITNARQRVWDCQDELGVPRTKASKLPTKPISAAYARWLLTLWQGRADGACTILDRAYREPVVAINVVFREHREEAKSVAWCESRWSTYAKNGQYENIFQMGEWERRTYGWHTVGSNPLVAARAAYRYFAATGYSWRPWQCRPGGHLAW